MMQVNKNSLFLAGFICIFFQLQIMAQSWVIGGDVGYHSYKMEELMKVTQRVASSSPFQVTVVSNYPNYFSFSGFSGVQFDNSFQLVLKYNYASTGSRISRSDYSGNYSFNSIANRNALGVQIGMPIIKNGSFIGQFCIEQGISFNKLLFEETLNIYSSNYELSSNDEFVSHNLYISPGLSFKYSINNIIPALSCGYEFNFNRQVLTNSNDLKLNVSGNDVVADWSGFYINVSVAFLIK
jgi:hypothetical protein